MEAIYERPRDYDLEHEGDEEDVAFYLRLLARWQPRRVIELAAGSGRVTIPLARAAAARGIHIVGLEREGPMLEEAMRKRAGLDDDARRCLTFMTGDMRAWRTEQPFDLVIAPCSSLSHLLTLDDQIAAWRCAWDSLADGGRFVVDLTMPNLAAYADSMQTPPRTPRRARYRRARPEYRHEAAALQDDEIPAARATGRDPLPVRQVPRQQPRRSIRQRLRLPRLLPA